jgi:uncharacterized protein with beta-barrel porin domain
VETHNLSAHAGNANSEWLWITLKENPMIEPSSPNGKAVYQYLQNLSGSGQMGTLVAAINGLTPSEQSKAMEMITGESIGTQTSCGLQHSTLAGMSLNSQIRGAGPSGTGGGAPGGFAANETDDGTIMLGQSLYIPVWHGWVAGYGMGGTIFADENTSKTGVSVGGVLFGVERMIDYTCKAGFFYSYGHAHNSVAELGSYVKSDDHLFGGYLSHDSDVFYCTLLGGIGYDDYHSARHNVIGAIDEWAYGTHTGWQSLESTEIGMRLETGLVTWEPYFTLQHAYIWQNAYTENTTLAPNTANSFSGFGMHSLRDFLGLRVRRMFYCWGHQSEWEFRSTWVHELLDQAAPIYSTQLAGASGNSSLVADGANLGRDWALLGAGTKWHLSSQIELFADYELFFNARQTLHTGMGGMAMSW